MSSWSTAWPERTIFPDRVYLTVWAGVLAIALSGSIGVGLGPRTRPAGYVLLAMGGSALALLSLSTEIRQTLKHETGGWLSFAVDVAGGLAFVTGVAFSAGVFSETVQVPLAVRLVTLATAFHALLLTPDIRAVRRTLRARAAVLLLSHGSIFAGSLFTLSWGPTVPHAGLLLYASGFTLLLLNTFWARTLSVQTVPPEPETDRRRWEALLLSAGVIGILGATVLVLTTRTETLTLQTPLNRSVGTVTAAAGIVALATLSAPRSAPAVLRWLDGPIVTVAQHVLTLFVLVNGFLLGVFVAVPWLLGPVFNGFLAAIVVGVMLNYAMLVHVWNRDHDDPAESADTIADAGVTLIITAANEVDALSMSLRENIEELAPIPVLLVPAARSTDGTIDLMNSVRDDHPDRVRVIEGAGGSKAADLNIAWDHVETPYAVVLDADETVGAEFVTRALEVLSDRPEVGIVQGRKLATFPDASRLSRFTSAERQHSTWLDHPFDADVLAAAHFAGSAAVLRQDVLPAVDGFDSDVLTEDIDLTIRLYLETDWDVAYVSEMCARELLPGTWLSLLRQRERWARGWAQVAGRHLSDVLRSGQRLGLRRTAGLSWLLFLAISAPLYTIFPALALPTIALDASISLSPPLAVALAILILPERALTFAVAVFRDPAIPARASIRGVIGTVSAAYLWIIFGWIVQLHSLYLQFAGAPRTWTVTQKSRPVVRPVPVDE